tara:strand:- start:9176 stop:9829 length:654 start_codon:yes stop_codon:yes gene_type:complete
MDTSGLGGVQERLQELGEAATRFVEAELAVADEVLAAVQREGLSGEDRHSIVYRLYWAFGPDIRVAVIAGAVGMKCGPTFMDYVGPKWMPWCSCGGLVPVSSRSALWQGPSPMHRCAACSHEDALRQEEEERRANALRTLQRMPYSDYLRSDHWDRVRKLARKAAGGRCQVCNSRERLEVHHRTYDRRGEEHPADLTVLCSGCHQKFHADGAMPDGN